MNKFLTFEGQQPFYLGDIDFMQEAVRTAFLHVLRGLTGTVNPSCIVQGLQVSDTGITGGVVCLFGELFEVPAASITGTAYLKITESFEGRRTLKSGELKACHAIRTATLTQTATAFMLSSMPRLDNLLSSNVVGSLKDSSGNDVIVRRVKDYYHVDGVLAGYDKGPGWMPGDVQRFSIPLTTVPIRYPHFEQRIVMGIAYGIDYAPGGDSENSFPVIVRFIDNEILVIPLLTGWLGSGNYISFSAIL